MNLYCIFPVRLFLYKIKDWILYHSFHLYPVKAHLIWYSQYFICSFLLFSLLFLSTFLPPLFFSSFLFLTLLILLLKLFSFALTLFSSFPFAFPLLYCLSFLSNFFFSRAFYVLLISPHASVSLWLSSYNIKWYLDFLNSSLTLMLYYCPFSLSI